MINSIFFDQNIRYFEELKYKIDKVCPNINLLGHTDSFDEACQMIVDNNPDLIFLGLDYSYEIREKLFYKLGSTNFETIIISPTEKLAVEAFKYCAIGFLLFPIHTEDLLITINNAQAKIEQKKERIREKKLLEKFLLQFSNEEVIGIPTMEGFEFLKIKNIIRCEGLQKCTRVVTKEKSDIVSSYNLGEFRKLLEQYGFYSPHKSYLINLKLIRKYYKEGSIIMIDGKSVPVAKRKKSEFLLQIKHI